MEEEVRFNKMVFLRDAGIRRNAKGARQRMWEMRCDCGRVFTTMAANVKRGSAKSCGCVPSQRRHAMCTTPIYKRWASMRMRCTEGYQAKKPWYAGVKCCPEWDSFEGFLANQPLGRPYEPGLVLARWGDSGNYQPDNCRWATKSENGREARERTLLRMPDGTPAVDVARANGLRGHNVHARLALGWSIQEAATVPIRGRRDMECR